MNQIIKWHQKKHKLQPHQLYRLLYENEFGDHIDSFSDLENQINNLQFESYQDLYYEIGIDLVRINLGPYLLYNLDLNYLYNSIKQSSKQGSFQKFKKLLNQYDLNNDNLNDFLHNYRIISKRFLTQEIKTIQILHFLKNINHGIIALEGKCGSGKTTLINQLKNLTNICVIPVDDFFLPEERKTKQRISEVGGNINYESIFKLLENIKKNIITYQRFDCTEQQYFNQTLENKPIIILEGVYSYHTYFNKFIDYLLYIDIDETTQLQRLKHRDNFSRFIEEWIILENKYYHENNIKYQADLII